MSKRSRVIGSPADGEGEAEAGPSRPSGSRARPVQQDAEAEDEDEKPIPTAAERGLTVDTFEDRAITGDRALLTKLKPLVKGFDAAREKVENSMANLQATAVSLSDAGMMEDEELFNSIDSSFRACLDELAMIEIRAQQLDKIYKDLLEDGNEITDVQGVYRNGCEEKEQQYKAKSDKAKYSRHPRYHSFRDRVWESRGTGEPMPLLSTLFAKDERTQPTNGSASASATANGTAADASDSDSDVELGGVVTSFKCPITLKTMEDPWTSTVCPHSFEHAAIVDYLSKGPATCPTSGCNAKLSVPKLKADPDLKRRAEADRRRVEKRREERENSAEDIESDEE